MHQRRKPKPERIGCFGESDNSQKDNNVVANKTRSTRMERKNIVGRNHTWQKRKKKDSIQKLTEGMPSDEFNAMGSEDNGQNESETETETEAEVNCTYNIEVARKQSGEEFKIIHAKIRGEEFKISDMDSEDKAKGKTQDISQRNFMVLVNMINATMKSYMKKKNNQSNGRRVHNLKNPIRSSEH